MSDVKMKDLQFCEDRRNKCTDVVWFSFYISQYDSSINIPTVISYLFIMPNS
jgi:hypothetical protein